MATKNLTKQEAMESVCAGIQEIVAEYYRQEENGYIDTPGGLEHMGDVWSQLIEWNSTLNTNRNKATSSGNAESGK